MEKTVWIGFLSGNNLKSKTCPERSRRIQNLKWVGLVAILVSLAGCVGMAEAQQPGKVPTVGFLSSRSLGAEKSRLAAFQQGLQELGYLEGKNILIEQQYAGGKFDRLPDLAAELVRLKVDVLVVSGAPAAHAAKNATRVVPIVIGNAADPVGTGLVASLARPGGNITGLSSIATELGGKRLELLKEVVPRLSRVAVVLNPANPSNPIQLKQTQAEITASGVTLLSLEVRGSDDIDRAFTTIRKERAGALMVFRGSDAKYSPNTDHGACGQEPVAGGLRRQRLCGCWRPHVLRNEFRRLIPACCHLCGQDIEGSQASRSSRGTADEV
jgi:putative ABC transport system substrate-binding protein